ncbi:hypothetical protein LTR56_023566 [Elasticomyces elasticus]|nr:hypothetical protein LTR56_023566 [Elasticomyces elasticus]KAK3624234.1 hypothetical protein LTR22_024062 [Elasticomyces elasticus]KAK4906084.1 hypothetical protein LTR49_024712 [Elasticomyces elasticus]KAK5744112.1 hypothetical protein LTS12_023588 [Elasticomyces elasticus]
MVNTRRIIILKEGDTDWMPPGVIVVHAPSTLPDCLMTGGMMWDLLRMRDVANNIEFISAHDTITNEDVPANLAKIAQTAPEMEEGRIETAEETAGIHPSLPASYTSLTLPLA